MMLITLAHSPDPDDAFMWWPLVSGDMDTGSFEFQLHTADIQALNERAADVPFDVTAMSCLRYADLSDRYQLTDCGASIGMGCGPKLVSRTQREITSLDGSTIAVPGSHTSAFAAVRIMLASCDVTWRQVPFDEILEAVADGEVDAGVVIHEGQLTYPEHGLHLIADLGQWWETRHARPMPLGVNAIARDLHERCGEEGVSDLVTLLEDSIDLALLRRQESLVVAQHHGRGIDLETTDAFVEMYVNEATISMGALGREAIECFLAEAATAGLCQPVGAVEVIGSGRVRRSSRG